MSSSFAALWTVPHHVPLTMRFLRQEFWSGCHCLLQEIFLTQVSNPHLLHQFSSVQSLNCVRLSATRWTAAHQASLSITNSQSLPKLMSIESVLHPTSHPLSSPSSPAINLSQNRGLSKWVSSSHRVAKVLEFQLQHQSFQ